MRRLYEQTHDTFACRFYDRLSNKSPCERFLPLLMPFRYGLEVNDEMPWTEAATLRFISEDGTHEKKFVLSQGTKVGGLRVFVFDDYRRNVKYRGEVIEGESVIKLFDPAHLFGVLDPSDADEVLPIPVTEPAVTPQPGPFIPPDTDPSRQA